MLFCIMSKCLWGVKRSIEIMERVLVLKEVQVEENSAHCFPSKLNDQDEVAQVSAKLTLINSCILLTVTSVLESHQIAVQFRRWYVLFTRFFTCTA